MRADLNCTALSHVTSLACACVMQKSCLTFVGFCRV